MSQSSGPPLSASPSSALAMKGFLFLGLDSGLEVRDEKVRRGRWRHGGTREESSSHGPVAARGDC